MDFTVSHETFQIKHCENCLLGITSPRPETEKLGIYYQSDEYISHSGKSSGLVGSLYTTARKYSLNWKARLLKKYSTQGAALDFGCGTGEFLQTLKNKGWQVEGVEPSELARSKASLHTNQVIHTKLAEISGRQFDVITAWHVLEHVPELASTLAELKNLLKKDGTLFIAVPNYESADAATYKDFWAGYDVPRHLWHFSKKSMMELLHSAGLTITAIIPMKLDAYYVSMLSEKYRSGSNSLKNLVRGFISGFLSNTRAGSDNYSSLIYIARPV